MKYRSSQILDFFHSLVDRPVHDVSVVLVTHIVPGREVFVDALAKICRVAAVIPKPKSIHEPTLQIIAEKYQILNVKRLECYDSALIIDRLLDYIDEQENLVILDMGGYFSESIQEIRESFNLLGIVEDTQNGHVRYESVETGVPVISVAQSPLKEPEDYLVGQSIIFSLDALYRERGQLLINNRVMVIGYGKIGSSIAHELSRRQVKTVVYDVDPLRQVKAFSQGYAIDDREKSIKDADIIICATGNKSLAGDDFDLLKKGAYIATVTSADDELDMKSLRSRYCCDVIDPKMLKCSSLDRHFYLINQGNAINFLHHAEVGVYIYLVQGEILKALDLMNNQSQTGVQQLDPIYQREIAGKWLLAFAEDKV